MKLAISNLAWHHHDDLAIGELLQSVKVTGVEIAPTKVWADPLAVSDGEVREYRAMWSSFGVEVVAIQALLFGRPDLHVFETAALRSETLAYLIRMTRLAGQLGAKAMVFGSPKNRLRGELTERAALKVATPFFHALAVEAEANGTVFCIEPNPAQYGSDWLLTTDEGSKFVHEVDHPGFGLNVDTGGMTMAGEDPVVALAACAPVIRHFHISEAALAPIGSGSVDHRRFASALATANYSGWRSIEMREAHSGSPDTVRSALTVARRHYETG